MTSRKETIDDFFKKMEVYSPTREFHDAKKVLLQTAYDESSLRAGDLQYMFDHIERSYQQHARYSRRCREIQNESRAQDPVEMPRIRTVRADQIYRRA